MKKCALLLVLFLVVPTTLFAATFAAALSGANEVPPADPDGSGTAIIDITGTTVNYTITVRNIMMPPIGQHIHTGAAGVNGGIAVGLTGTWVDGTLTGSVTTDAATAAAINANPQNFYVNVHTNDYPGGAIRGQLSANVPALSTTALIGLAIALAFAGALVMRKL